MHTHNANDTYIFSGAANYQIRSSAYEESTDTHLGPLRYASNVFLAVCPGLHALRSRPAAS